MLSEEPDRAFDAVRARELPVEVSDNPDGLFGFYNRREVIDWPGDEARIVEQCELERRNRVFAVCRP